MNATLRIPLRIVFYREDERWLAHCLEFDLIGDGETQLVALEQLSEAISLQIDASIEHGNPRNLFSPADGRYFQMFAEGKDVVIGEIAVIPPRGVVIDRTETRQYTETSLVPV